MKVKELFDLLSEGQYLKLTAMPTLRYEDILIYEKGVNEPKATKEMEIKEILVDEYEKNTINAIVQEGV